MKVLINDERLRISRDDTYPMENHKHFQHEKTWFIILGGVRGATSPITIIEEKQKFSFQSSILFKHNLL